MKIRRPIWNPFPTLGLLGAVFWPLLVTAAPQLELARPLQQLGYETVELRRTGDNHWFLFGKVEGRRRSCLIDTGWSYTTISTNTAARLPATNRIAQLALGPVTLTNELVRVEDLRVNGQPTSYDVVLGCDFLRRHQAILDCVGRRLYLRNAALPPPQQDELHRRLEQAGWRQVNLTLRTPWALTCTAQVNGNAVDLLVDSGATWSCLDAAVAKSFQLRPLPTLHRMTGPAAKGQRSFAVADLKSWQLDDGRMPETSVAVLSLKEWGLGPEGNLFGTVGGILGGAELQKLHAVIDCGAQKLWLRPGR